MLLAPCCVAVWCWSLVCQSAVEPGGCWLQPSWCQQLPQNNRAVLSHAESLSIGKVSRRLASQSCCVGCMQCIECQHSHNL
jgi:hypothetical protein